MTDEPMRSAASRTSRGLRAALAISVALNLAVAGLVGGALLRPDGPRAAGAPRDLGFGIYSEALTREDRAELRRRLIQSRPGLLQDRQAMRGDMERLIAALRADPFDPQSLDDILQAQVARMKSRLSIGQTLLRDYVLDMSPETRRAFADRLQTVATRGSPLRGRPPGG